MDPRGYLQAAILESMKQGRITTNGVVLLRHENRAVVFLTQQGYDIELLPPVQREGARTPDIRMRGLEWEIKSPVGKSSNTIKRAFKTAIRQSSNLIFDIRGSKATDKVNISKLEKEFMDIRKVRNLLIITKKQKLIDLHK